LRRKVDKERDQNEAERCDKKARSRVNQHFSHHVLVGATGFADDAGSDGADDTQGELDFADAFYCTNKIANVNSVE